jgi:hypothetical protein
MNKLQRLCRFTSLGLTAFSILSASSASAAIYVTNWTTFTPSTSQGASNGSAAGTLTYPGGLSTVSFAGDVFGPSTTVAGNSGIFNSPIYAIPGQIPLSDHIATDGSSNTATTHTITLSPAVTNPIMYINTLGRVGIPQNFTFTSPFTILSASSLTNPSGNILRGIEGDGVIQFSGSVSQIQWTTSNIENTGIFQVGVSVVPEPTSSILAAMAGGCLLLRRRRGD